MKFLYQILFGIIFFGSGLLFSIFPRKIMQFTGEFPWTNRYLGAGGTMIFYMLLGIFLIFLGFLTFFGFLGFLFK